MNRRWLRCSVRCSSCVTGPGWSSPVVVRGRVFVFDVELIKPVARERLHCFDEQTGKELWVANLAESAKATPITYQGKDGKQYVAIVAAA